MAETPLVSVLIPVYNGAKYVAQAIESVVWQTLMDWELILIDDGSTDDTLAILESYAGQDKRIRLFPQEHRGLVAALNHGLALVRGRYLARLDADDLCLPERLEAQVACLEARPELVILGSAIQSMDQDGASGTTYCMALHDTLIRGTMIFGNPFVHSSVMLRNETLKKNGLTFDPQAVGAEDYELWSRLIACGEGMNLDRVLICRRMHSGQISFLESDIGNATAVRVTQQALARLGFEVTFDQAASLRSWQHWTPTIESDQQLDLFDRLFDILEAFGHQPGLDEFQLRMIRARWLLRYGLAKTSGLRYHLHKTRIIPRIRPVDLFSIFQYRQFRRLYLPGRLALKNVDQHFIERQLK
jgi:glycosyltransferase involved in cell wall biosynthesis